MIMIWVTKFKSAQFREIISANLPCQRRWFERRVPGWCLSEFFPSCRPDYLAAQYPIKSRDLAVEEMCALAVLDQTTGTHNPGVVSRIYSDMLHLGTAMLSWQWRDFMRIYGMLHVMTISTLPWLQSILQGSFKSKALFACIYQTQSMIPSEGEFSSKCNNKFHFATLQLFCVLRWRSDTSFSGTLSVPWKLLLLDKRSTHQDGFLWKLSICSPESVSLGRELSMKSVPLIRSYSIQRDLILRRACYRCVWPKIPLDMPSSSSQQQLFNIEIHRQCL